MSKIEINNVYKIFGNNPKSVLPMVKDGATKEEVLDKTGHTVGLDDVSLKIKKMYEDYSVKKEAKQKAFGESFKNLGEKQD